MENCPEPSVTPSTGEGFVYVIPVPANIIPLVSLAAAKILIGCDDAPLESGTYTGLSMACDI